MDEEFRVFGTWKEGARTGLLGLIALDDHGRLLMQLRDEFDGVPAPGEWGLFGGHQEPGETPMAGILREIKEELGMEFSSDALQPLARYSMATRDANVFLFQAREPFRASEISLGEGAGFAFLNRHQILNFPIAMSVRDFVRDFMVSQKG